MPPISAPDILQQMQGSTQTFIPNWSHLDYWHLDPFIPLLGRVWGYFHAQPEEIKKLLVVPLMKVTRFFSYGDEKVHKLYRSRRSKSKIAELLEDDWQAVF